MLELYQTEWCPASRRVRQRLTELGLDYLVHQVPVERERRKELESRAGVVSIPVLLAGDHALLGEEAILHVSSWSSLHAERDDRGRLQRCR
jgi:glutaredoxin